MKAKAVIGNMLGDEGKGLATDLFSDRLSEDCVVIRYNSGAQAGHTVVRDGIRHVFSHFGSGTIAGRDTFLSQYFVCNPLVFNKEREKLKERLHDKKLPRVFVDPHCYVTTPFDIILNQAAEMYKGENKHGSCGLGFGETIHRSEMDERLHLRAIHLNSNVYALKDRLTVIKQFYFPHRLTELTGVATKLEQDKMLDSLGLPTSDKYNDIIEAFMMDCQAFVNRVSMCWITEFRNRDAVVFEGAQGLMLDMDYGWFPYVTRSNTGLKNVVSLANQLPIKEFEAVYVSRAYTTRHGRGPLPYENGVSFKDKTNVNNQFQESLRFAPLYLDFSHWIADYDYNHYAQFLEAEKVSKARMITHLDQIDSHICYIENDEIVHLSYCHFDDSILLEHYAYGSEGETAKDCFTTINHGNWCV